MAHFLNPVDITALPAWPALHAQRQAMQHFNLREAFASDAQRFERYSLESCGLFLDYSKNLIDEQSLALLLQLAIDVPDSQPAPTPQPERILHSHQQGDQRDG